MLILKIAGLGMVGVLSRFAISNYIAAATGVGPIGTMAINVMGSLAAGWVAGSLAAGTLNEAWRVPVLVGFLGGFTTFSAMSLETVQLWEAGRTGFAAAYSLGSLALGTLAMIAGLALGRGPVF